MTLFKHLFAARPDPREGLRPLWQAIVDEARRPDWYARAGAADTVAGRFDMVTAVLAAVLVRMESGGDLAAHAVLLTELFVQDMDGQLREFGVGDVIVGKRVGKLMEAMGGRLAAYRTGLAGDDAALIEAVGRNMTLRDGGDPAAIAAELRIWADRLARTDDAALLAGKIAP